MAARLFVVSVSGGLCNRLRVLASAIAYCERFGCTLLVRWPLVDGFMATLPELFDSEYRSIGPRAAKYLKKAARFFGGLHDDLNYEGRRITTLNFASGPPLVSFVETVEKFGEEHLDIRFSTHARRLRPVTPIQSLVRGADAFFAGGVVAGASIRVIRAHPQTTEASPPAWFVKRIRELHALAPHIRLFLSCDDLGVTEEIRRSVPCPVFTLEKPATFNSVVAIQAAVADLFLLGRSAYILGSHFSSFSETAYELQGTGAHETGRDRALTDAQIADRLRHPR